MGHYKAVYVALNAVLLFSVCIVQVTNPQRVFRTEEKREINMPISIGNQNTPTLGASSLANAFKQISGSDGLDPNAFATNLKPQSFNKAKAQEIAPTADPNVLKAVLQVILGLVQLIGASTAQAPQKAKGINLSQSPFDKTEDKIGTPSEQNAFQDDPLDPAKIKQI